MKMIALDKMTFVLGKVLLCTYEGEPIGPVERLLAWLMVI